MYGDPSDCLPAREAKPVPRGKDSYQQSEIRKNRLPFNVAIKEWATQSSKSCVSVAGVCFWHWAIVKSLGKVRPKPTSPRIPRFPAQQTLCRVDDTAARRSRNTCSLRWT